MSMDDTPSEMRTPATADWLQMYRMPRRRQLTPTREDMIRLSKKFIQETKGMDPTLGELFEWLTDACGYENGAVRTMGWELVGHVIDLGPSLKIKEIREGVTR